MRTRTRTLRDDIALVVFDRHLDQLIRTRTGIDYLFLADVAWAAADEILEHQDADKGTTVDPAAGAGIVRVECRRCEHQFLMVKGERWSEALACPKCQTIAHRDDYIALSAVVVPGE